jgi:hypothetical protein
MAIGEELAVSAIKDLLQFQEPTSRIQVTQNERMIPTSTIASHCLSGDPFPYGKAHLVHVHGLANRTTKKGLEIASSSLLLSLGSWVQDHILLSIMRGDCVK